MNAQCCVNRTRPRFFGRVSKITGALVPGAALLLLPKCPLCLAAWLTVATGLTCSATQASWLRVAIMLLWTTALAHVAWRRVFRRVTV
jgi:hypothetical protein